MQSMLLKLAIGVIFAIAMHNTVLMELKGDQAKHIINFAREAKKTLDVYAEDISDPSIIAALEARSSEGVVVRVCVRTVSKNLKASSERSNSNLQIRKGKKFSRDFKSSSFIVEDNQKVWYGSPRLTTHMKERVSYILQVGSYGEKLAYTHEFNNAYVNGAAQ